MICAILKLVAVATASGTLSLSSGLSGEALIGLGHGSCVDVHPLAVSSQEHGQERNEDWDG